MKNKETFLYKFYDENNQLLYTGISLAFLSRLSAHRFSKKWFKNVKNIKLERYRNEEIARKAEKHSIINELPIHNIKYHPFKSQKKGKNYSNKRNPGDYAAV